MPDDPKQKTPDEIDAEAREMEHQCNEVLLPQIMKVVAGNKYMVGVQALVNAIFQISNQQKTAEAQIAVLSFAHDDLCEVIQECQKAQAESPDDDGDEVAPGEDIGEDVIEAAKTATKH